MKYNINKSKFHTESPLFVVGFARSGTTFLAELLNRHSNIAIPSETRFFREFYLESLSPGFAKLPCESKVKRMLNNRWFSDNNIAVGEVCAELSEDDTCEYKDLFIAFLKANSKKFGKSRYGEKTPIHLLYVDKIFELYPQAKIICIVRDGRDAILSIVKTPWKSGPLMRYAADWDYRARLAVKFAQRYPDSFMIVKYEDLLLETENTLVQICEFIDEKFEETQLQQSVNSGVVPKWESEWKDKALKAVDRSRVFVWKRENDSMLVRSVGVLASMSLSKFGYVVPEVAFTKFESMIIRMYKLIFNHTVYSIAHRLRDGIRYYYFVSGIRHYFCREDIVDKLRK